MKVPHTRTGRRWSLFCRVVDNFGDIGVCWRLARSLATHHGQHVTLWLDDLASLQKLYPRTSLHDDAQQLDGVLVRRWAAPFDDVARDDVVIEAFACELPDEVLAAMAARPTPPVWINLEYLSAEAWIEGCHRLPSPHPVLPLRRHFFFPGFSAATGGLLREPDLLERRDYMRGDPAVRNEFLAGLIGRTPTPGASVISLFCYEQSALSALLSVWAASQRPVELLVPDGRVVADVARHFGHARLGVGEQLQDRALSLTVLPFVDQDRYDRLLWSCDINFVRGEDSFVRAQWAVRPFVWHIYRQAESAHEVKLDVFLQRFLHGAPAPLAAAVTTFWRAWNGSGDVARAWPEFAAALPQFAQHCERWTAELAARQDLAESLLNFVETGV